jgi:hypothetical protein
MRSLMYRQINQLRRLAHPANRRFLNRFALPHQRDHATVVIGIHLAIQQVHAIHLHGLDNGIDFGLVPAFRKVRNTFHEC